MNSTLSQRVSLRLRRALPPSIRNFMGRILMRFGISTTEFAVWLMEPGNDQPE